MWGTYMKTDDSFIITCQLQLTISLSAMSLYFDLVCSTFQQSATTSTPFCYLAYKPLTTIQQWKTNCFSYCVRITRIPVANYAFVACLLIYIYIYIYIVFQPFRNNAAWNGAFIHCLLPKRRTWNCCSTNSIIRYARIIRYGLSHWELVLWYNVVSDWLSQYPGWFLIRDINEELPRGWTFRNWYNNNWRRTLSLICTWPELTAFSSYLFNDAD